MQQTWSALGYNVQTSKEASLAKLRIDGRNSRQGGFSYTPLNAQNNRNLGNQVSVNSLRNSMEVFDNALKTASMLQNHQATYDEKCYQNLLD